MDSKDPIQWVYTAPNRQVLNQRYDQWAQTYEQDLTATFGYTAPQITVSYFTKHVPKTAKVLDAGVGTGLVGQQLHQQGYEHLVGLDMSAGMLAEARQKGVYTALHQAVLGEALNFPSQTFDAIISTGVFTLGHAPAHSFEELVRLTKPNGAIVFTLNSDILESGGFQAVFTQLESDGKWRIVEVSEPFTPWSQGEPKAFLQVWVYQVL